MKRLAILALLLICGTAHAEPNEAQWLKIFGELRDVPAVNTASLQLTPAQAVRAAEVTQANICLMPEIGDVELATSSPEQLNEWLDLDDIGFATDLQKIHESAWNAAKGSNGSWPLGCHEQYPGKYVIKYYIDANSFPTWYHERVRDADHQMTVDAGVWGVNSLAECRAKWGDETYLEVMLDLCVEAARRRGILHIRTIDMSEAQITISSKFIPGSTIGYAYYNSQDCSTVTAVIDNSWRPNPLLHNICWLNCHEWCPGHCGNLRHEFARGDKSIMSYSNLIPFQGFREGNEPGWSHGKDSSVSKLVGFFGPDPAPKEGGDDPPKPPTGEWKPPVVGSLVTQIRDGFTIEMTVTKVGTDEGDTLEKRLAAAVAAVEYARKDHHRAILASVYEGIASAVNDDKMSVSEAHQGAQLMRGWLVGANSLKEWDDVLKIVDSVTTADGFTSVARGLGGAAGLELSPAEIAAAIHRSQAQAAGIPPNILAIIKLIVPFLPPQIQGIVQIILAVLEGFSAEDPAADEPPAEPKTAYQRAGRYRSRDFTVALGA